MPPERQQHAFSLDMRYLGQSFTLQIPYEPASGWTAVREAFDHRHEEAFGYATRETDVEIVNVRLVSLGLVDKPQLRFTPKAAGDPRIGSRLVWFDGWVDCALYERERMPAQFCFEGPAVVTEAGGTSVVPLGWHVRVHESGSMLCSDGRLEQDWK
jgi:N-methylhydantoinase A/oxoprolinase/acetone carboxylase beta subunit